MKVWVAICHCNKRFAAVLDSPENLSSIQELQSQYARTYAVILVDGPVTIEACCCRDLISKLTDSSIYYRNLAIKLGAEPNTMLNEFDRNLCTTKDGEGEFLTKESVTEVVETWERVEKLEEVLRDTYYKIQGVLF